MSTEVEVPDVAATLRAIQQQLATLTDRVAALEAAAAGGVAPSAATATAESAAPASAAPAAPATPPAPGTSEAAELDEETLLVISAAIAAFLGKKPHIRQIRLLKSPTWAQQGRVGIHASHAFAVQSRSGATS